MSSIKGEEIEIEGERKMERRKREKRENRRGNTFDIP